MKIRIFPAPVLIGILLILGFLFRLYLSSLYPHVPIFDEKSYVLFAEKLLNQFWYADCCAYTYGYPFFIALVFKVFGINNYSVLIIVQSLIDVATALLLFTIAGNVFRNKFYSWIIFGLYLINPLTASYTGLYLSEVWGIFLLVLSLYILVVKKNTPLLFFLFGIVIGLFTFTRIMFFWWTMLFLVIVAYIILKKRKIVSAVALTAGFLITWIYPVISNYKTFKVIAPTPVIPVYVLSMVEVKDVVRYPGIIDDIYTVIPEDIRNLNWWITTSSPDSKTFMEKSKPGIDNALKYFSTHPFEYLVILGRNILYFWDKTNLFYYEDPFYPQDKYVIRTINIIFLFLSMIGIAAFIRLKKRMEKENLILIATLSLIFYLTIPMSFLVPEDRLTLPAYPILLLFLPLGMNLLIIHIKKIIK